VDKKGDLPGYRTVWFYEDGIANILSLNNVKKKYCVIYDSTAYDCFEVHKADGTKHVFKSSKQGLFYSFVNNDAVLVTTVRKIKSINTLLESTRMLKKHVIYKTS